jgi:oxygen-independent coproporphyrinogen-3 oxidase
MTRASSAMESVRAAYVHIPFCVSKCYYCDFNSYPGLESLFRDYVRAVVLEIEIAASKSGRVREAFSEHESLSTIYFGGGTPTVLPTELLEPILQALKHVFGIDRAAEVTIEANPESVDKPKLEKLRSMGFNRLSLGVQSLDDKMLERLGRIHRAQDALRAFWDARQAGFESINLDLMFGLPGQTLDHLENELRTILHLRPEHLSMYELTAERKTPLASMIQNKSLSLPDEEAKLAMYEKAISETKSAGYEHYEVSNFALPGFRCRHNQVYWRNEPFYGFGAGATSYLARTRTRKLSNPRDYISAVFSGQEPVEYSEKLADRALLGETILLGLRMLDGIDLTDIQSAIGLDPFREFGLEIADLVRRGLVELRGSRMRVTHDGLLLLNDVSEMFVEPRICPTTSPSAEI